LFSAPSVLGMTEQCQIAVKRRRLGS
jgi:hypothetical protein